jgi:hypothetical protein
MLYYENVININKKRRDVVALTRKRRTRSGGALNPAYNSLIWHLGNVNSCTCIYVGEWVGIHTYIVVLHLILFQQQVQQYMAKLRKHEPEISSSSYSSYTYLVQLT